MKSNIFRMLLLGLCVLLSSYTFAQVKVSGIVKGSSGEVLPGATIVVKGTTNGVVTNNDGQYTITLPDSKSTLVVSFIGMESRQIAVNGKSAVDVTLIPTSVNVDEVVVTALGIKKSAKALGYNVNQVNSEQLNASGVSNPLKSLEGKVTGVQMNSLSSNPTSSVLFTIRGATSLNGILQGSNNSINNLTQPLIVIDGIPVSDNSVGTTSSIDTGNRLTSINPDDIESISILKGSSAAALYGSSAGSGVVLITTKTGASAKKGIGVTYSNEFSINQVFNTPPIQRTFMRDATNTDQNFTSPNGGGWAYNDSKNIALTGQVSDWNLTTQKWDQELQQAKGDKDPLKAFLQTGTMEINNLAITGNYDKGSYRFNYSNMIANSVVPNNPTTRNNISFNSTYKVNNKITISSEASYAHTFVANQAHTDGHMGDNPLSQAMSTPIDMPKMSVFRNANPWLAGYTGVYQNSPYLKHPGGDRLGYIDSSGNDNNVNEDSPYFLDRYNTRTYSKDVLFGKAQLDYAFTKSLKLTLRSGMDFESFGLEHKAPWDSSHSRKGGYEVTQSSSLSVKSDAILAFNKYFLHDKLSVDALGGVNLNFGESSGSYFSGMDGLAQPNSYSFGSISQNSKNNANIYRNIGGRSYSVYATATVGWKGQVYLDVSGRNDWSGTLAPDKVSHFYPGGSLSWLISETFKDQLSWASLLKIRGGIAETGYGIGHPYNLDTYGISGSNWAGQTMGTVGGNLVDAHIKPELNVTEEAGLDFGILKNRITGEFTAYQKDHINQIQNLPVTASSGFGSILANMGSVRSKGIELGITVVPIKNKDWEWSVTTNYSTFNSVIQTLDSRFSKSLINYATNTYFLLQKGQRVGDMYASQPTPVIQSGAYKGQYLIDPSNGFQNVTQGLSPDMIKKIGFIGNINPKAIWSFNTNLKYKSWNLGIVTSFKVGGSFVSGTARRLGDDGMLNMVKYFGKNYSKYYVGGRSAGGLSSLPDPNAVFPGDAYSGYRDIAQSFLGTYNTDPRYFGYMKAVFIDPAKLPDSSGFSPDQLLSLPGDPYMVNGADPLKTFYYEPYYMEGQNFWNNSQMLAQDATFFKIKEINLSFHLSQAAANKLSCQNITFSAFAKNVWYFAKNRTNEDPETAFNGGVSGLGVSNYGLPPVRIMGLKVTLGF